MACISLLFISMAFQIGYIIREWMLKRIKDHRVHKRATVNATVMGSIPTWGNEY